MPSDASWVEGEKSADGTKLDETSWELGHFLALATHCNPTILEVFAAPVVEATEEGHALQAWLPDIWNPQGVRDAFVGYGLNQRKKFLDGKGARPVKYAVAYLRVLCRAVSLLGTGVLPVDMTGHEEYETLRRWRAGDYRLGEVIDKCAWWTERVDNALPFCTHAPDLVSVNNFLLALRRRYW